MKKRKGRRRGRESASGGPYLPPRRVHLPIPQAKAIAALRRGWLGQPGEDHLANLLERTVHLQLCTRLISLSPDSTIMRTQYQRLPSSPKGSSRANQGNTHHKLDGSTARLEYLRISSQKQTLLVIEVDHSSTGRLMVAYGR